MEKIKGVLNNIYGGKVLDVGTGRGEFIDLLKENLKDYTEIIGIDMNDIALEKAKERFKDENIDFIKMDAENLKFENNTFDIVSLSNSIHHLPNMQKVLNEMKRVLKPGGYFLLQEMFCDNQNENQLTHVYFHHFNAEIQTLTGGYHNKTLKKQEILDIGNSLTLENLIYFECIYEEDNPMSDEKLKSMIKAVDESVYKTKNFPQYESYKKQGQIIKERLSNIGMSSATELFIMGNK
ncbi:class I SAM-dependent methyltransferase [Clostridium tagluense]|uniref:class I SAM-dependent methyltransferase n=1 Tax=Clostridium tagluense TaxID=360422 RepID=UPI001CF37C51|nr:class I SAM-dependent methyltransferase [Clostridium tagluense]MCB2299179.1 class I SAM-dependent methyltransferase [Clostridium tagluense]